MVIEHIAEFIVLAQTENFLEASMNLYISQSTLSKHIKALEKSLGCTLFDRTTRQCKLNENGRFFLTYARQIAQLHHECKAAFRLRNAHSRGSITIGSIPILAQCGITDAIVQFNKVYPNYDIHIIEEESANLKELLHNDKCDFAFIRDVGESDDHFVKKTFKNDQLVAVFPRSHPYARLKSIQVKSLQNESLLLLHPQTLIYRLSMKLYSEAGIQPNIAYTSHRIENIIDLVEKGGGVALLMRQSAEFYRHSHKITLVDLVPTASTRICLYYNKSKVFSPAAQLFLRSLNMLDQTEPELSPPPDFDSEAKDISLFSE